MSPHARVIIATYNQVASLKLVLRGYLRQTTNDFSLVLADDGSGPDQGAFLREIKPKFEAYLHRSYQSFLTSGSPPSQSIIWISSLAAVSNNSLIYSELIPCGLSGLLPA